MTTALPNRNRRAARLASAAMSCAVSFLLLAGCSSDDSTSEQEAGGDQDTGLSAQEITAAIEPDGFTCAEEDPGSAGREEAVVCKGDDFVIITATRFTDPDELNSQLEVAQNSLCDFSDGETGLQSAVSGSWLFVPGGSDDKNVEAFDKAMTTLGLESNQASC